MLACSIGRFSNLSGSAELSDVPEFEELATPIGIQSAQFGMATGQIRAALKLCRRRLLNDKGEWSWLARTLFEK
jgi:hypothetical protein